MQAGRVGGWSPGWGWAWIAASALFVFASGFAPFDSAGLAELRILAGTGVVDAPRDVDEAGDLVESDALFHTLSSRYGGGGVLILMEFTPSQTGYSGLLLLDVRHAGLKDLYGEPQGIGLPNRRRAEVYYQEWDKTGDLFLSDRAEGTITVEELYRGEGVSAIGLTFDLRFVASDGSAYRDISGSATTSPTVEQAVKRDGVGIYDRREDEHYAPDGDIYVDCTGEAVVEEEEYEEDSYTYEDEESDGCDDGDTWEDDSTDPDEEAGCEAREPVDDGGEPDPDSGCEGTGDELEDPGEDEQDDLYYDESSSGEDSSGCDDSDDSDDYDSSDDSSSDDSSSEDSSGCSGDDDDTGDTSDSAASGAGGASDGSARASSSRERSRSLSQRAPEVAGVRVDGPVCEASTARVSGGVDPQRAHLRATLDRLQRGERLWVRPARPKREGLFSREDYRTVRRISFYLPFFLLGVGLHVLRRRMRG